MSRTLSISILLLALFVGQTPAQVLPDMEFVVREAAYHLPINRLDPHVEFWLPWDRIFSCIYETPLRCDPDSDVLRLEPKLLVTLPTLSDDGTLLKMQFRKDVRFADDTCFEGGKGRAVTAHDFAFVLKRHLDPRTKSPYYNSYLAGSLLGARRARAKAEKEGFFDYDLEVPGIKVIDDYKVELRFLRPYSRFPSLMTMTWLSIMPFEAVRKYGSGMASRPVGTGPYLYDDEASTASKLVFKRNSKYWNAASGGTQSPPLPWNAGVEFIHLTDVKLQEKRFLDGDLSVVDLYPIQMGKFIDKRGRLKSKSVPKRTRLVSAQDDKLQYIAFNMTNKVLGKKKVRQALCLAIDRDRVVSEYFSRMGDVSEHICPPAIPIEAPGPLPWEYGNRDLDRARALLAEAGYPGGKGLPEFVLETTSKEKWEEDLTVAIKSAWAKIGVRVQVRLQDYNEMLVRIRKGLPQISINYWQSDYPDPDNFFMMLTRASWPARQKTADSPNVGFYENQEYEKLYRKSMKLLSGKKRGKVFAEMVGIIQEDCPWVFLGHNRQVALTARGVQGIYTRSRFSSSYARVRRDASKNKNR
ncbi:MAG: oligopeptide transport system substrate-binding protein [Planctomycetota bacterium]|jgi:oligopeptide transport system substrate-binding protein